MVWLVNGNICLHANIISFSVKIMFVKMQRCMRITKWRRDVGGCVWRERKRWKSGNKIVKRSWIFYKCGYICSCMIHFCPEIACNRWWASFSRDAQKFFADHKFYLFRYQTHKFCILNYPHPLFGILLSFLRPFAPHSSCVQERKQFLHQKLPHL